MVFTPCLENGCEPLCGATAEGGRGLAFSRGKSSTSGKPMSRPVDHMSEIRRALLFLGSGKKFRKDGACKYHQPGGRMLWPFCMSPFPPWKLPHFSASQATGFQAVHSSRKWALLSGERGEESQVSRKHLAEILPREEPVCCRSTAGKGTQKGELGLQAGLWRD